MRNVFSIIFNAIAGFFFYMVSLLGFVNGPPIRIKWGIVLVSTIPAVLALYCGLALKSFQNWKRNVGIVLLCASGFTAFAVLTFVCLLTTEEFRIMMKPGTLTLFSDYFSGGAVVVGLAMLGLLLIRADKVRARP